MARTVIKAEVSVLLWVSGNDVTGNAGSVVRFASNDCSGQAFARLDASVPSIVPIVSVTGLNRTVYLLDHCTRQKKITY